MTIARKQFREGLFFRINVIPIHLPPQFALGFGGAGGGLGEGRVGGEKAALLEALRQTGGNQTQAARLLGVNRVTVWHRMRKYGIDLKGELKKGRFLVS